MRWILLIAIVSGIAWTANYGYHSIDNLILITDLWIPESSMRDETGGWGLVNYKNEQGDIDLYKISAVNGFGNIFKTLWPVWSLFILIFLVMIPVVMYIYNGLANRQINVAKQAQLDAESSAEKCKEQARKEISDAKYDADMLIKDAYRIQYGKAKKELSVEQDKLHRELQENARLNQQFKSKLADLNEQEKRLNNTIKEYQRDKERFESELNTSHRARDNAQSGHKRLKLEKESISAFLDSQDWTIGNEKLTYKNLKKMAKN